MNAIVGPEVWLIRHGETEWSRDGRHTSRTDVPLTERGREQAQLVGERLRSRRFVRVLTSPLSRALGTCVLAGFGDRAEVRPELREWDYGSYEGIRTADIWTQRPGWTLWRDGAPDGEMAEEVARRVDPLIAEWRASEGDIVAFAHGHVLRVVAARWVGLSPQSGGLLALDAGAVSVLGWEHESPVIRRWNADDHLHCAIEPAGTERARHEDRDGRPGPARGAATRGG